MIKNMRAIEYNLLMTILKLLNDRLPQIANEYGIVNKEIYVSPAYPTNLTDIKKPSIIVRKVDTSQSKIGFGNVLGQFYDNQLGGYVDIVGKRHDIMIQFDIIAGNNTDRLLFESMVVEDIMNDISFNENGMFTLYDFTGNKLNNPEEMGTVKLVGDSTIRDISDEDDDKSSNVEYIGIIRHNFSIIQTTIPKQEYVDLSKWIKQTYTIKL